MFKANQSKKSLIGGITAGFILLGFYFLALSLTNSFSHALSQFLQMWYWILILVVGFGIQVGLYIFIRESQKMVSAKVLATSGGISTGSMIACCLHHLVDVLPIMGLAAAALFLIKYQVLFLVIGILSNLIGITIMLEVIQKSNLTEGFLKKILILPMGKIKKATIGLSLVLFLITFFAVLQKDLIIEPKPEVQLPQTLDLSAKINRQAGISFEITPLDFSFDNPLKFEIKIDTHSGSLDFDLTKISTLEDDKGKKYQPLAWQGSPPGGHHRSGTLIFPPLESRAKKIKLTIQDAYLRIFEWNLEQ